MTKRERYSARQEPRPCPLALPGQEALLAVAQWPSPLPPSPGEGKKGRSLENWARASARRVIGVYEQQRPIPRLCTRATSCPMPNAYCLVRLGVSVSLRFCVSRRAFVPEPARRGGSLRASSHWVPPGAKQTQLQKAQLLGRQADASPCHRKNKPRAEPVTKRR